MRTYLAVNNVLAVLLLTFAPDTGGPNADTCSEKDFRFLQPGHQLRNLRKPLNIFIKSKVIFIERALYYAECKVLGELNKLQSNHGLSAESSALKMSIKELG
jgi:hypothetical protein